jgi:ParB family chromosome partitioning protein
MAKRKLNASMMLKAGKNAHLQTHSKVSQEKLLEEKFLEIDVEKIENNPMQPRLHIATEALEELSRSIVLHGLIQPIAVIEVSRDKYILKAGQRRWMAHKLLGRKTIKAIVKKEKFAKQEMNDKAFFEIAVMENTQRDNLNPLELALSLRQAMDKKLYSNLESLSLALGKSKSYVSKVLKVLLLEDEIIQDLSEHKRTNDIEALYEIQKIKESKKQIETYFDFVHKKLNRQDVRNLNKVKVSQEKLRYEFSYKPKRSKLEFDSSSFSKEDIEKIKSELEEVLKKYL